MSGLGCARSMRLVERVESGLDEAERLRLEEHLASCGGCAHDATLLEAIGRVTRSAPRLDDAARARALSRAFASEPPVRARAGSAKLGRRPATPRAFLIAAAAFAFGLMGLAALFVVRPRETTVAASAPSSSTERAPADVETQLADGATLELPHAEATALAASRVRWDEATTTLRVLEGELRVEVEPNRPAPFRVEMERYTVEVLGTIFEVRADSVSVERGRVRVSLRDGSSPVEVGAGDRWSATPSSIAPANSTTEPEVAPAASASAALAPSPTKADPSVVFARARKLLAAGDAPRAKRLVEGALAGGLNRNQEAEAKTLLAECALVGGDTKEAARRYAEVASQHKDLPAGETALFAAARTAHKSGQKDDARRLFRQYLDRYPQGKFANEARARLSQL